MPISPASATASIAAVSVAVGPDDEQFTVHAPRREEVDRAARDPDRHPQGHRAAAHPEPADALDRPLHLPGRPGRARLVTRPVEEEQQRVAAPLDQPGTPLVRLVEQRVEHAVERVAQELGPDLPAAREPLGQCGEPEMSTNARDPSTAGTGSRGESCTHSIRRRGTYGFSTSL